MQPNEAVTRRYSGCNTQFEVCPYYNDEFQYSIHELWYQKSKQQKLDKTMCDKTNHRTDSKNKFVQPYEVVTQCYPGCDTQFYFKVYPTYSYFTTAASVASTYFTHFT